MAQQTLLDRHLDAGITPDLERPRWPWALFALLLVPLSFLVFADTGEVVIHSDWFVQPVPEHHPVAVEPDRGIRAGDTLVVRGEGFPLNIRVAIVLCSGVLDLGGGRDHCELDRYAMATVRTDGTFQGRYTARRHVVVDGQTIDCATPPPSGAVSTCVVGVGTVDGGHVGHAPIHLVPDDSG